MPGIFDSLINAVKSRYLSGSPGASLTAGPGSVLDQRNTQMQPLLPQQSLAPHPAVGGPSPQDLVHPAPYGTRPGQKLIDTTDMLRPLGSGFSNVKRSQ
jgi:hypothetical protein